MKKILIIGASGFIGEKIISALCNCQYDIHVQAISKSLPLVQIPNCESISLDISDISLFKRIPFEQFDVVLHLATVYPSEKRSRANLFTVNTSSLLSIVDRIVDSKMANKPIIIFFSAISIFRGTSDSIITHSTQSTSTTEYDLSKSAAELCLRSLENAVIIRIPLLLESGASRSWLTNAYHSLLIGEDIVISNPNSLYNHVVDLDCILCLIFMLIENGSSLSSSIVYPVNLASTEPLTIRDIIMLMKSITSSSSNVMEVAHDATISPPPLISIEYALSLGLNPKSTHEVISNYASSQLS